MWPHSGVTPGTRSEGEEGQMLLEEEDRNYQVSTEFPMMQL